MPTNEPRDFCNHGKAYLVQYTVPQKFTSIKRRSTFRSRSSNNARIEIPALQIMTSTPPKRSTAVSIRSLQSSSFVTSVARHAACPPAASIRSQRASSFSPLRAPSTTRAPAAAYSQAIASPMPDEAPVMTTVLSFKQFFIFNAVNRLFRFPRCRMPSSHPRAA